MKKGKEGKWKSWIGEGEEYQGREGKLKEGKDYEGMEERGKAGISVK